MLGITFSFRINILPIGVEEEDRKITWMEDADNVRTLASLFVSDRWSGCVGPRSVSSQILAK